ncbi:MucBP domain-containing protein [Lactobacillus sp. wkB8]
MDDYVYDSVNGNRIGYFTNMPQTVTYVYHKKAPTTKPEQSTDNN